MSAGCLLARFPDLAVLRKSPTLKSMWIYEERQSPKNELKIQLRRYFLSASKVRHQTI